MKRITAVLLIAAAVLAFRESGAEELKSAVTDVIDARRSASNGTDFPAGALTDGEIGTLLWAASGRNRSGTYTVPLAKGSSPYVNVYVARADGVFRYDPGKGAQVEVLGEDIRSAMAPQGFARVAPAILLFTLTGRNRQDFEHVAVGAMTQNVALVAAEMGIGTRYIASLNAAAISKALDLPASEVPFALMPLGR